MKNTTINKIVGIILLAGVCEIGLVGVPAVINLTRASDKSHCHDTPGVI